MIDVLSNGDQRAYYAFRGLISCGFTRIIRRMNSVKPMSGSSCFLDSGSGLFFLRSLSCDFFILIPLVFVYTSSSIRNIYGLVPLKKDQSGLSDHLCQKT